MEPDIKWLEDPEVFEMCRMPAHSDHQYYETMEDLEKNNENLKQSLDGKWGFSYYPNYEAVGLPIKEWGTALEAKDSIRVPGHMELQGYGKPQYTNCAYPWDGHAFLRPPMIDWENNSIGFYVKEFDLNKNLQDRKCFISFQGAEEALYVWLNGRFIGYGEDSFTPSDFEITDWLKPRGNRLCAAVFKRSSAAWIEDQDFFRFSGLFRQVFLYAKPKAHVEDLSITAVLDEGYRDGMLEILAKVSGTKGLNASYELLDSLGMAVESGSLIEETEKTEEAGEENEPNGSSDSCENIHFTVKAKIKNVTPWNVGAPYLYTLILKIEDSLGNLCEAVPYKVGFRTFEIKNRIMHLNGKRLLINGVNRHEWSPVNGRAITEEDMRKDIEIMKENNINAVRTCHYPNQSLWYRLCDEAGIIVMDETNLESHGTWQIMGAEEKSWNVPGSNPKWQKACIDRAKSMYERDKNHACILWWSCGNESHMGTVIADMCRFFHEKDKNRLVHYEGVIYDRSFDGCTDVESRMYASPSQVREYLENNPKKPMLLCEYMHNMGNSIGGMESYMKLRDEFPMFQGGFIWDYIDQAVYYTNADGKKLLGYGGDFGDRPTNYAFSGNGIMCADRREKPVMQEVRYWYQDEEKRRAWDRENERLEKASFEEIAARQAKDLEEEKKSDGTGNANTGKYLRAVHTDFNLGIKGEGFHYIFSYHEGGPVSIKVKGKECLYRVPRPAFWRASTENDLGNGFPTKSAVWFGAEMFSAMKECRVYETVNGEEILFNHLDYKNRKAADENITEMKICYVFLVPSNPASELSLTYCIKRDGKINVRVSFEAGRDMPQLPLLGVRFIMPEKYEKYCWTGLSGETYPDRHKGGRFGTHEGRVKVSDFLVPQECQNHVGTHEMEVGGLKFVMDKKPFQFSVLPYTPAELECAQHIEELPISNKTVVSIIGFMRGVGGIDSWGADVEPEYQLQSGKAYEYSFYIEPGIR